MYTLGKPPSIEIPSGPYPMPVHTMYNQYNDNDNDNINNKTKVILQAYAFTKYLGNAHLQFNKQGDLTSWSGDPILLDQSIDEDEPTRKDVVQWKTKVDLMANVLHTQNIDIHIC